MCLSRFPNYVLVVFISIFLLQDSVGLASATPLAKLSGKAQAGGETPAKQTTNPSRPRRSSRRRRGSASSARGVLTATSTSNSAMLSPPPLRDGLIITPPTNDKTSLDETLEYIRLRMKDYGGQSGYSDSGGEILKDVTFSGCSPSMSAGQGGVMVSRLDNGGGTTTTQTIEHCSISWVVTFKEDGTGTADITRTAILKLKDLNLNGGVVVRKGVIWIRTDPYRSITVTTTSGASNTITEDEWWIDLHDEEVARRVARALQHAAQKCRGETYVEKFTK